MHAGRMRMGTRPCSKRAPVSWRSGNFTHISAAKSQAAHPLILLSDAVHLRSVSCGQCRASGGCGGGCGGGPLTIAGAVITRPLNVCAHVHVHVRTCDHRPYSSARLGQACFHMQLNEHQRRVFKDAAPPSMLRSRNQARSAAVRKFVQRKLWQHVRRNC